MRVYHFLPSHFGLEDLRERRLKIARLDELNDPFEFIGYAARDVATRKAFENTKTDLARHSGMLCFSRGWRNPVQWSHYADRHRGLCLGLDIPNELLVTVSYVRRRPVPDLEALSGTGREARDAMLKVLATKFSHWRYEDEVRVFTELDVRDPATGLYFKEFGEDLVLREVIVGPASTLSRADIASALGASTEGVRVRKARLAFRSFRVVEQRRTALWV